MKKILITGVAGFIGSNFARELIKENYHVYGIDDLSQGFEKNIPAEVEFTKCSIVDKTSYLKLFEQDFDSVFHFAALNSISIVRAIQIKLFL